MEQIKYFLILIFFLSCVQTPPFSKEYTVTKFQLMDKKVRTNEELDSKDLNIIFKTLNNKSLLEVIDQNSIAQIIIFSKEKNLARAYMEAYCRSEKGLLKGLKAIHKDNPKLIEGYLEYFESSEKAKLRKALF